MIKNRFVVIGIYAFILNLIWEFSHYSLYLDLSGIPPYPHLIIASVADALLVVLILAIISLKKGDAYWVSCPRKKDYFWTVVLGLAIAALNEKINLDLGRWEYTAAMPLILEVGISPLIQLAATAVLSLALASLVANYAK